MARAMKKSEFRCPWWVYLLPPGEREYSELFCLTRGRRVRNRLEPAALGGALIVGWVRWLNISRCRISRCAILLLNDDRAAGRRHDGGLLTAIERGVAAKRVPQRRLLHGIDHVLRYTLLMQRDDLIGIDATLQPGGVNVIDDHRFANTVACHL